MKDAGEIGAGHSVTALYEIVPAGNPLTPRRNSDVEPLKYQPVGVPPDDSDTGPPSVPDVAASRFSGEMMTVKLRYKPPTGQTSRALEFAVTDSGTSFANATGDFRFASAVALFAMLLKDSPYCGESSFDQVLELTGNTRGSDPNGYRSEFLDLVRIARELSAGESFRRDLPAD